MNKQDALSIGTKLASGRYTIQGQLSPGIDCYTYLANDGNTIIKEFRSEDKHDSPSNFSRLTYLLSSIKSDILGINILGTYHEFLENYTTYCAFNSKVKATFRMYEGYEYGILNFKNSYRNFLRVNKDTMSLFDMLYPIWLTANTIYAYYANDYVYMNLHPEKILVATNSSNKPIGIQIIETGSMRTYLNPNDTRYVYNEKWSAPGLWDGNKVEIAKELSHGYCDVFSLGAILFFAMTSQTPNIKDMSTFHTPYKFNEEYPCIARMSKDTRYEISRILEHSLRIWTISRYDSAFWFARALGRTILNLPETDKANFSKISDKMMEWQEKYSI